jgi:hypothetical protein
VPAAKSNRECTEAVAKAERDANDNVSSLDKVFAIAPVIALARFARKAHSAAK